MDVSISPSIAVSWHLLCESAKRDLLRYELNPASEQCAPERCGWPEQGEGEGQYQRPALRRRWFGCKSQQYHIDVAAESKTDLS